MSNQLIEIYKIILKKLVFDYINTKIKSRK